MIRYHRDLIVWQKAMELAKAVYWITRKFPAEERFGLTSQIRRAAVSVPSNIAEGQARKGSGEFCQFLHIALGSLAELDTQLILAGELDYLDKTQLPPLEEAISEIRRMIFGLIHKVTLRKSQPADTDH